MIALVGCGKGSRPTGTVRGSVTIRGEKLTGGQLCVISEAGDGAVAAVAADGTYSFQDRLPVGDYTVWLTLPSPPPPLPPGVSPSSFAPSVSIDVAAWARLVPSKYQAQSSSPLSLTVKPGVNEFLIEIAD